MVTAVVLLDCEHERINEVAEALAGMPEVSEVYSVAGGWDLVAMVRVHGNEELAEAVTGKMVKIEGIEHTETLIAFRVYSRHDIENMFGIGFEEKS